MEFEVYQDAAQEWRWRLRAGEGYKNRKDCMEGVSLVRASQRAEIKILGEPKD